MTIDLVAASHEAWPRRSRTTPAAALGASRRGVNGAWLVASLLLGAPIVTGTALTIATAFGYLPAIGGTALSFAPWRRLFAEPGLAASLRLTASVGLGATLAALALAFAILATPRQLKGRRALDALLAPLLASPHSAVAVGFAFLIAPSGWLVRLLSPWATGFDAPPDVATVGDPLGLALAAGLVVKETPFLLAVSLGALGQFPAEAQLGAARALGHAPAAAWLTVVAPQLYARIRLPVYAVLAYALSVVDMAPALAPSHPAPLSVLALRWFLSPDLGDVFPGAAAAILQFGVVGAAIGVWRLGEIGAWRVARAVAESGRRGAVLAAAARFGSLIGGLATALGLASLAVLVLWAFAARWPFPHALPDGWGFDVARRQAGLLARPFAATLALALLSSAVALGLAIAWLESDDRAGRRSGLALLWLPLVAPQIAFLFGVETLFAALRVDGAFLAVAWAHTLFVFPYVMLALADPWRALDPRYARAAAALGAGRCVTVTRVKLPILLRPLFLAFAIGVAVSVAQYLSTLFAGGGRVATLTTEALALAAGGDRRLSAIVGLAQAALPCAVYGVALVLPRVVFAKRRGLRAP